MGQQLLAVLVSQKLADFIVVLLHMYVIQWIVVFLIIKIYCTHLAFDSQGGVTHNISGGHSHEDDSNDDEHTEEEELLSSLTFQWTAPPQETGSFFFRYATSHQEALLENKNAITDPYCKVS